MTPGQGLLARVRELEAENDRLQLVLDGTRVEVAHHVCQHCFGPEMGACDTCDRRDCSIHPSRWEAGG